MAKLAAFVLGIIILTGVAFPLWAGAWPQTRNDIDESLKEKGLLGTIGPLVHGLAPTPQQDYPGYERLHADVDEPEDYTDDPSEIVINVLQDHGYHGPITINPRWSTYEVVHSRNPGDWASIWCDGRPAPSPVHPYYEDFNGDFRTCDKFFSQGRGEITLRALTYKW
jgi:hypothetical protein